MDKINSSSSTAGTVSSTLSQSTTRPGDHVLSDGLTHVGNRSLGVSRATTLVEVNHGETALPPVATNASENQAAAPPSKVNKDQINMAIRQSVRQSASSRFGVLYPVLDIKTDANIINNIIDISIAEDVPLEDAEDYFTKNIVISLPNRPGMNLGFANLTVCINSKMSTLRASENLNADVITKYLFSSDQSNQYSEKIIIPSKYFKTETTASIVLRNIIDAANDSVYAQIQSLALKKNDTDTYHAREQIFAIALGVYRLADFFKTRNNPALQFTNIDEIMQDFPELIHLGLTIERNRPVSTVLSL